MDLIKQKLKLSIPLVTLFQNYVSIIRDIASLDKSTVGDVQLRIKSIAPLVERIRGGNVANVDDVWQLAELLDK